MDTKMTFEAWAGQQGYPCNRLDLGGSESYQDLRTHGAWEAWEAGRAALLAELRAGGVELPAVCEACDGSGFGVDGVQSCSMCCGNGYPSEAQWRDYGDRRAAAAVTPYLAAIEQLAFSTAQSSEQRAARVAQLEQELGECQVGFEAGTKAIERNAQLEPDRPPVSPEALAAGMSFCCGTEERRCCEINNLRNVIQSAFTAGCEPARQRWNELFPDDQRNGPINHEQRSQAAE